MIASSEISRLLSNVSLEILQLCDLNLLSKKHGVFRKISIFSRVFKCFGKLDYRCSRRVISHLEAFYLTNNFSHVEMCVEILKILFINIFINDLTINSSKS